MHSEGLQRVGTVLDARLGLKSGEVVSKLSVPREHHPRIL